MKEIYNEDYYENGEKLNISGYTDYRWLPHLTKPMCQSLIDYVKVDKSDWILDFGCAKGFLVKSFKELGYRSIGVDISSYAINNSDPTVRDQVFHYNGSETISTIKNKFQIEKFDLVVSKDVFEHIPYESIDEIIRLLSTNSYRVFAAIPLGKNGKYVIEDYEKDITHIIREDLQWWSNKFISNGFSKVKATYRVNGIKENWKQYPFGNGFFLASN